jgi:MOSC domain-containing protein YiiM
MAIDASRARHRFAGPYGDPACHLALPELEARLAALPAAPRDRGTLLLIVTRDADHRRDTPREAQLSVEGGVSGDRWQHGSAEPDAQLAVMQIDVAKLLANGQTLTLFGDNLFVDLDLSAANLPAGSRLRMGAALVEVTPEPHDGCRQFRQRFGGDALRITADRTRRHRNLRGIYMRVVEPGRIAVGDAVLVVSRATA